MMRRQIVAVALVATISLTLSACSGGPSSPAGAPSSPASPSEPSPDLQTVTPLPLTGPSSLTLSREPYRNCTRPFEVSFAGTLTVNDSSIDFSAPNISLHLHRDGLSVDGSMLLERAQFRDDPVNYYVSTGNPWTQSYTAMHIGGVLKDGAFTGALVERLDVIINGIGGFGCADLGGGEWRLQGILKAR